MDKKIEVKYPKWIAMHRHFIYNLIGIMLIWGSVLNSFGQCEADTLVFIDAAKNQIDATEANGIVILKDGGDTLFLAPLYDPNFTKSCRYLGYEFDDVEITDADSIEIDTEQLYFCSTCKVGEVTLVDSIDMNEDGVKELLIRREWNCGVTPSNIGAYGVGSQQQTYSRYEIWDLQAKKQLVEINNIYLNSIAVTTNLVSSYGYQYEVKLNADGTVLFSNFYGSGADFEMGTYRYDVVSGQLLKIGS